jgi:hypothetical protein
VNKYTNTKKLYIGYYSINLWSENGIIK